MIVRNVFRIFQNLHLRMPSGANTDNEETFNVFVKLFQARYEVGEPPMVQRVHIYIRQSRGSDELVESRRAKDRRWKERVQREKSHFPREAILHPEV